MIPAARLREIQARRDKRQEPLMLTCTQCRAQQLAPHYGTIASGMAMDMNRCLSCGGILFAEFTIGGSDPTPDDDLSWLLDTLAACQPYLVHKENCNIATKYSEQCTCGLDHLLAPGDLEGR